MLQDGVASYVRVIRFSELAGRELESAASIKRFWLLVLEKCSGKLEN
jgi:hypothetical protein